MAEMGMKKMTEEGKRKVINHIFWCMMQEGQFNDANKMFEILNGIYYLLGSQEKLSPEECDFCILCFFQDYSMGLKKPLTDSDILSELIPAVRNYPKMDLAWAVSWLTVSLMNVNHD